MQITRIDIRNLRSIVEAQIEPGAALNLFVGDNGAGKTSVLESLHVMGYGRSFRGRVRDGLIRHQSAEIQLYLEWRDGKGHHNRAGLEHHGMSWKGRLNGESVSQLGEMCSAIAVSVFEPNSHSLISGGAESRRRFLDWGLFHVEQSYLGLWRRYMKALKQRNALLKSRGNPELLDGWDRELANAGEALSRIRREYLESLEPWVASVAETMLPLFGVPELGFHPGWKYTQMSLHDALIVARDRDFQYGYSSVGPHRADWVLRFSGRNDGEAYSRGQAKLTALMCLLAQARHMHAKRGEWPVILLDDFSSELDARHRRQVLQELVSAGMQVFMTSVDVDSETEGLPIKLFHVEHGVVRQASA